MWCVDIIESEEGWGQKLDETKEFGPDLIHRKKAEKFVEEHNKDLGKGQTPSIYWRATKPYWKE